MWCEMVDWVSTAVPKELLDEITKVIQAMPFWTNEREFIRDAIREKLNKCAVQAEALATRGA